MMEKVTAGATAALGNIEMDGFSADNLTSMVGKVTAGATAAMGDIQVDGFSADNLTRWLRRSHLERPPLWGRSRWMVMTLLNSQA